MEHLLLSYSYIAFLLLSVIEGPIVTVVGAFLASQGYLNIYGVYLLAVVGDTLGDSVHFFLGRYGGDPIVRRFGVRFGVTEEALQAVRVTYFASRQSLWKIITLAKLAQVPCSAVLITCGLLRISLREFTLVTVVNNCVKVLVFTLIGFYFGQHYKVIVKYVTYVWILLIPVFLVMVFLIVGKRVKYIE